MSAAASVLVEAFWTYPETLHLLSRERTRRFGLSRFMRSSLLDSIPHGEVLGARMGRDLLGVAIWKPPSRATMSSLDWIRQGIALAPVGIVTPSAATKAITASNIMRRRHPKRPHHYLAVIGVQPEKQSAGIGASLIEPITARADEERVGCYLTTATAANASWYSKFGFRITEDFNPTPNWPRVWALWRDPQLTR